MSRLVRLLLVLPALLLPWPSQAQVRARHSAGLDRETQAQQVLDLLGAEHVLREAWRVTTKMFYDKDALPEEWEAIRARYELRSPKVTTPEEAHALVNEMLGELKTSHLALMERGVFLRELFNEFRSEAVLRLGCELEEHQGRLFVAGVGEGSAAAQAGLLTGDELVQIAGQEPRASGRLDAAGHDPGLGGPPAYFVDVNEDTPLEFTIRREENGPLQKLVVTPRPTSLVESCQASVRIEQVGGRKVGVIHLPHFMSRGITNTLKDALREEFAAAEALVLDIRGRGGRADVMNRAINMFGGKNQIWDKPVVCLIDRGSRSAKEIFSWQWKRRNLGPLIGETTAGAVIGCTFVQLSDSSILMVPAVKVTQMTQGEDLEGVGVDPTEAVAQHPLPYRGGRDAILAAGLQRAASLVGQPEREPVRFY